MRIATCCSVQAWQWQWAAPEDIRSFCAGGGCGVAGCTTEALAGGDCEVADFDLRLGRCAAFLHSTAHRFLTALSVLQSGRP